jgi:hypothetical protein
MRNTLNVSALEVVLMSSGVKSKLERLEAKLNPVESEDDWRLVTPEFTPEENDDMLKVWHLVREQEKTGREFSDEEAALINKVVALMKQRTAEAKLRGPLQLH